MSAPAVPPTAPTRLDEAPLSEYRAVSRAAVLALVLGFSSALVLVSPLLVLVPLAGLVAGLVALRNIGASGGLVVGRGLATAGLCLTTLLGGWGLARHFSRQATVASQAIELADGFLARIKAGQREAAHQLVIAPAERQGSPASVADFYKSNSSAAADLKRFFENPPLPAFIAAGPDVAFRLDSLVLQTHQGSDDEVVLKYVFEGGQKSIRTTPIWIFVARTVDDATGLPGWRIARIQPDPPPGTSG